MRRVFWLKIAVHLAALAPLLWLLEGFRRWRHDGDISILTANPVEKILLVTGTAALTFLLITLAITPLRRLTGRMEFIPLRRLSGLYAFFHACIHLATFAALDLGFDFSRLLTEFAKRRFITAGLIAFLCMLPLALTSTRGWIRRLGKNWARLHLLIYPAAFAAIIHFIWKVKVVTLKPALFAMTLALLLGFRLAYYFWKRKPLSE